MAWVQIAAATLLGNRLRQTVHTNCASVHQAQKIVATLLRVARVPQTWQKVMAAYCRVYDSCYSRLTANNRDQLQNPTLGNRVWASATFTFYGDSACNMVEENCSVCSLI